MSSSFKFKVIKKSRKSNARIGEITTPHGKIQTPCFMPVATAGAIRCLDTKTLNNELQANILLANTYHLHLRPGDDIIKSSGSLHKYMNWPKPILTDSGGYQIFSLAKTRKITPKGAYFSSHIDGSKHFLSPEKSIKIQQNLGSDIMMVLDECPPSNCPYEYANNSLILTLKWAKRCKKQHNTIKNSKQALFGIVQGALFPDLRKKSVYELLKIGFDGYAIGGLAVGETSNEMYKVLKYTTPLLPENKPRYLMGVGRPENIKEAIKNGIDMFDCVMPTRNARHGYLFSSQGTIRIKQKKYKKDFSILDKNCSCSTCKNYTPSYLRHIFINNEPLSMYLNTIHNLNFYLNLVKEIRQEIIDE